MAIALYTGVAPVVGATVTVNNTGTLVPAPIFADTLGTPLPNPFTANQLTGAWRFYADDAALYDVVIGAVTPPPATDLVLLLTATGVSPARLIRLWAIDQGNQVVLAQATY